MATTTQIFKSKTCKQLVNFYQRPVLASLPYCTRESRVYTATAMEKVFFQGKKQFRSTLNPLDQLDED